MILLCQGAGVSWLIGSDPTRISELAGRWSNSEVVLFDEADGLFGQQAKIDDGDHKI